MTIASEHGPSTPSVADADRGLPFLRVRQGHERELKAVGRQLAGPGGVRLQEDLESVAHPRLLKVRLYGTVHGVRGAVQPVLAPAELKRRHGKLVVHNRKRGNVGPFLEVPVHREGPLVVAHLDHRGCLTRGGCLRSNGARPGGESNDGHQRKHNAPASHRHDSVPRKGPEPVFPRRLVSARTSPGEREVY